MFQLPPWQVKQHILCSQLGPQCGEQVETVVSRCPPDEARADDNGAGAGVAELVPA